jgi:hypothetical protein
MSWGFVAGAAIVTIGGAIQADENRSAANKAADAQRQGLQQAGDINQQQLIEARREYDAQMQEYQRRTDELQQQHDQLMTNLAPFQQAGQGALYEMLALSGIAAPGIAAPAGTTGGPAPGGITDPNGPAPGGITNYQEYRAIGYDLYHRFGSKYKDLEAKVQETYPNLDKYAIRKLFASEVSQLQTQNPNLSAENIYDRISSVGMQHVPVSSPYAGMTGDQAQQAAIAKIADSPVLRALTQQGEQAILQNASATGGLRGGNVQSALAQYRPAMLQKAISDQYAQLGQIASTGTSAITAAPYTPAAGSYPANMPQDSTAANLAIQQGNVNAQLALAKAQADAKMIGSIAQGVGYGVGGYLNQAQNPAYTYDASQGSQLQSVVNPDGTVSYF